MVDRQKKRPDTIVILAMSADGKIADVRRSPARFSSPADRVHLEQQIAASDAVLFGAGTLRAYGTTLSVSHPQLLQQRKQCSLPPQPLQILASVQARVDPQIKFFRQPVPRWLLTTTVGAKRWKGRTEFEKILVCETTQESGGAGGAEEAGEAGEAGGENSLLTTHYSLLTSINWVSALQHLSTLGVQRLAVLGGGELVASLVAADLIDEFWLTLCPLILGGATAPTPVAGTGFYEALAPRLELLSVQVREQEVFLHYRLQRTQD